MKLTELRAGRQWLADHGYDACLYVRPDPDGLAAGALIARRAACDISFADPFANRLDRTGPMIIVDQGIRPVQNRSPVLFIDRHDPAEVAKGTVLRDEHPPAASVLAWRLIEVPVDARWLAALGVYANAGAAGLDDERLTMSVTDLRRLVTLCRAPTRLRDGPVRAAFAMLSDADSPQEALHGPWAAQLGQAHQTVDRLAHQAAAVSPRVGADAALVDIDVPARVHAEIATLWAKRLAPLPVMVVNHGWRSGQVAYAIRGTDSARVKRWLRSIDHGESHRNGQPARRGCDGFLAPASLERIAGLIRDDDAPRQQIRISRSRTPVA